LTQLILKRGKFSRPSGQWKDEDCDVFADGKVVGRMYEDASASMPPELRWITRDRAGIACGIRHRRDAR
jgi:hypothetical protein